MNRLLSCLTETDAGIGFNASIKPNSKPQLVNSAEIAAQTAEGGTQ